jgi:hypothetical protein
MDNDFWKVFVKITQEQEQTTAQIRDEYLRLSDKARRALREWVDRLALAGEAPVRECGVNMGIQIYLQVQGLQEMERVAVSPKTLAKALAASDQGEEYVHTSIEF